MSKKYFYITVISCLILILGIASFNWLINPFSLFRKIDIDKLNIIKPAADLNERLSKAYEVIRLKPEGLVLGNSRALALPTIHPGWSHNSIYNLALSSSSMYEVLRYFQHANNTAAIKEVILSLTISMFLPGAGHPPQYNDKRLKVDIDEQPNRSQYITYLNDIAASTLSFDATRASIKTINKNRHYINTVITGRQDKKCKDPNKNHVRIKKNGGHARFFLKTNNALMARNWPYTNTAKKRKNHLNRSIQYFIKLIRTAYKQGIKLHIVIPPGHALLYETWYIAELWPVIENWKKILIDINEQIAAEHKQTTYPIWDFSDYNSITMEPVPSWDDVDTPMNWFWETLHFKAATAHLMLDKIFNRQRSNCIVPSDFGVRINKDNISRHISNIHKQHEKFKLLYPVQIQRLKQFSATLKQ